MPKYLTFLMVLVLLSSCNKQQEESEWLIPADEVRDGGPGKDGIPSVDEPRFVEADQTTYLEDDDLVVGVMINGTVKAYPHPILDWHEVVNDVVGGEPISVVYCPLTGTATIWSRNVCGAITTFGVSGLLYNSNVIPYDRETDSNWSQMEGKSVNGTASGREPKKFQAIETTWKTWKTTYPNSLVMTEETGFTRNYGSYPYGDYITNHSSLLFPVTNDDSRLPRKTRVLGLLSPFAKLYNLDLFQDSTQTIIDNGVVITGNQTDNFITSFMVPDSLVFEPVQGSLPIIMQDQEGNQWDLFGYAVSGPRLGEKLPGAYSYMGYYFAFGSFHPGISIY